MAWVAVASAAITVGGNALFGGKGGGGGGGSPVAAADPFASQRGQYQSTLQQLMTGPGSNGDPTMQANMRGIAMGTTNDSQNAFRSLSSMMTPGSDFQTSDPSYQFRLKSGMETINRGMAKGGMLGSGNQMAELMQYGQGMASQEFGNEFQRRQAMVGTASQMESQRFGQLSQIDQNSQNLFQNNYSRLAQLSGANSGQPGQAGQLLAGQQAGAAAAWQKIGGGLASGAKQLWDTANSPSSDYGYLGNGGTGTNPDGSADSSYGQYSGSGTQAPVDLGMDW